MKIPLLNPRPAKPLRNKPRERAWLTIAEAHARVDIGWVNRVCARLEWAQTVHGDRWKQQSLHELLAEIRAEAEDLGGWPALTSQALRDPAHNLTPTQVRDLDDLLAAIAELGAQADELVHRAECVLLPPT